MKTILNLTAALALITPAFADEDHEIRLADCPQPVQDTIQNHLKEGKLDEIEVLTIEGRTLYVADIDLPRDRDLTLHINPDGSLRKSKLDVSINDVPAAVRNTIESQGGKVDDIDAETTGNTTVYLVDLEFIDQADLDLTIAADGRIIRRVEDHDD